MFEIKLKHVPMRTPNARGEWSVMQFKTKEEYDTTLKLAQGHRWIDIEASFRPYIPVGSMLLMVSSPTEYGRCDAVPPVDE